MTLVRMHPRPASADPAHGTVAGTMGAAGPQVCRRLNDHCLPSRIVVQQRGGPHGAHARLRVIEEPLIGPVLIGPMFSKAGLNFSALNLRPHWLLGDPRERLLVVSEF